MKKLLLILVVLVLAVLPAISAGAMAEPASTVEVQFPNGGWLVCSNWEGYQAFPFGMYNPPALDSPEFQLSCNQVYEAAQVIVNGVTVFAGPGSTTVNPHTLLMQ
jgi:hypothetical protein